MGKYGSDDMVYTMWYKAHVKLTQEWVSKCRLGLSMSWFNLFSVIYTNPASAFSGQLVFFKISQTSK